MTKLESQERPYPLSLGRYSARFAQLSVLSAVTTVAVTVLLHESAGLGEEVAYLFALLVSFGQNFIGMRYYVNPGGNKPVARQLLQFMISSLSFRSLEYLAFLVLHTWIGVQYVLATCVILVCSYCGKSLFYRYRVFR